MRDVVVKTLENGAQVMWATPSSGYGHVADEQPLPHIRYGGRSLTPRFGGDESLIEAGYESLPLPKFTLLNGWPFLQRAFNLKRRRINIYWRKLFTTPCRSDNRFLFAEQLDYKSLGDGFLGWSPLVTHRRRFAFAATKVFVFDSIRFNCKLEIEGFVVLSICSSCEHIRIECDYQTEIVKDRTVASSTGRSNFKDMLFQGSRVSAGQEIKSSMVFEVPYGTK